MKILLSPDAAVAPVSGGTTTATPAPSKPSAPSSGADSFDSLDAQLTPKPKPAAATPAKDKPADKAPDKPVAAAADKGKEGRTLEPKALREAYDKLKTETGTYQQSIATLERRIAEAEAKGKDTTVLSQRLADLEKELNDTRGALRAAKQEMSPEFVAKYDKPYKNAAEYAKSIVDQLQVGKMVAKENGDGTSTNVWQADRQASWDRDFPQIYSLPLPQARARAKELFGEDAPTVMELYANLHRLNHERSNALEDEKATWAKKAEEESAREVQQKQATQAMQEKVRTDIANKYPDWFKDTPGDDEGNRFLQQGAALVNAQPKTFEDYVIHKTQVELRAAGFPRAIYRLNKANERIAELEAKLKEDKEAAPGDTKRPTAPDTKTEKGWKEELREAVA